MIRADAFIYASRFNPSGLRRNARMLDGSSPKAERAPHIDTGGGAHIGESVQVEGGDFVGRDKIVNVNNYYAAPQPPAEKTPVASPPRPFEPAMLPIPGGEFVMGGEPPAGAAAHTVTVAAFTIGKHPVTNGEYAEFVRQARRPAPQAGGWTPARVGWDPPAGQERHPVVGVSWDDAIAYCRWLAAESGRPYRLPSEAEWEKAARGSDGRRFPWGDAADPARCNCAESGANGATAVDAHSPAGDSPYGCAGMAGNVWEWTNTRWGSQRAEADYRYPYRHDDGREAPEAARGPYREYRICRGGSYRTPAAQASCTARTRYAADSHDAQRGFRVAFTPSNP
jgi:formylglycine-generating enzyme required for sulfatase activity